MSVVELGGLEFGGVPGGVQVLMAAFVGQVSD